MSVSNNAKVHEPITLDNGVILNAISEGDEVIIVFEGASTVALLQLVQNDQRTNTALTFNLVESNQEPARPSSYSVN